MCAGDKNCANLCGTVRRVCPQASAERWRGEDAVRQLERRGGLCRLHCWQSWKPVRKDVGPSLPWNTTAPRRQAESGCRQSGHGEAFASPPSGQAGHWPWLLWSEGNNPFFPGPGRGAKAAPLFGVDLFIDTLCARIWKYSPCWIMGHPCLKMLPQNFQTFTMTGLEQEVSALRLPPRTGSRSLLRDSNFP